MRNFFFILSFILFSIPAHSQKLSPFSIKGKLYSDTATGIIYLGYQSKNKWTRDSCQVVKGAFSFSGKLIHPVFGRLIYKNKMKELFLEPAKMSVLNKEEDFTHTEITGSRSQREYEELDNNLKKIAARWKWAIDSIYAVNKKSNTEAQELKERLLKPYFEEIRAAYIDFFRQKPASWITAYYLGMNVLEMNQGGMPTEDLKAYYDNFPASVRNSLYGDKIIEELKRRKVAIPGAEAVDFTKTDINGQSITLSSFRGKYVLLDFWASWCVPCRKGNPHLKELYNRYKEKGFEIIGIAEDNDTKDAWLKAVAADGLPWRHILADSLSINYNVSFLPTKFLIDDKGVIIGRFDTDDRELDRQLKSIFN